MSIFLEMGVLYAGSFGSSPVDSINSSQTGESQCPRATTGQGSFGGRLKGPGGFAKWRSL